MAIQQLSVFLENKPGTLSKLTQVLANNKINMKAMSLADTYDFGIARIITEDINACADILRQNNYVVNITSVLALNIANQAGSLNNILKIFSENSCNVEYMYGFTGKKTNSACMIVRTTDVSKSESILQSAGIELLNTEDLSEI